MEARASNFEHVLADFESHLKTAVCVAVDMELTGVDIKHEPDNVSESASERLSKLCRIAERHAPIQIGFTLLSNKEPNLGCASYNFYAFPWVGPELLGDVPSFVCQASALQFNSSNDVDFNAWIKDGVPYMSREAEARYLTSPLSESDGELLKKTGMLRLWKVLCKAHLPLIVHCPLDLLFLLTTFEQRELPRDHRELAELVDRCFSCVYDTAHLHGVVGSFQNLALLKFLDEAKAQHADLTSRGLAIPCEFEIHADTVARYGDGSSHAHEAGYDSLATAQLFAYLTAIDPDKVRTACNRLFLFKSGECIDLKRAATCGQVGRVLSEAHTSSRLANQHCPMRVPGKCPYESSQTTSDDVKDRISSGSLAHDWLEGRAPHRFQGVVKSFSIAKGFGFIECAATFRAFQRDVFLHHAQVGAHQVGQIVSFKIATNSKGQPQATDVQASEGRTTWSEFSLTPDEEETTLAASSEYSSDADGESNKYDCRIDDRIPDFDEYYALSTF